MESQRVRHDLATEQQKYIRKIEGKYISSHPRHIWSENPFCPLDQGKKKLYCNFNEMTNEKKKKLGFLFVSPYLSPRNPRIDGR